MCNNSYYFRPIVLNKVQDESNINNLRFVVLSNVEEISVREDIISKMLSNYKKVTGNNDFNGLVLDFEVMTEDLIEIKSERLNNLFDEYVAQRLRKLSADIESKKTFDVYVIEKRISSCFAEINYFLSSKNEMDNSEEFIGVKKVRQMIGRLNVILSYLDSIETFLNKKNVDFKKYYNNVEEAIKVIIFNKNVVDNEKERLEYIIATNFFETENEFLLDD